LPAICTTNSDGVLCESDQLRLITCSAAGYWKTYAVSSDIWCKPFIPLALFGR
jgi:hypothetical protein